MEISQEDAAVKIQALQRGAIARRKAQEERKVKRENVAAAKIQALQRGRLARQHVSEQRRVGVIERPHIFECATYFTARCSLEALRRLKNWEEWTSTVESEVAMCSGTPNFDGIFYSTTDAKENFANRLTPKLFAMLLEYDRVVAEAKARRAEHEAIEAAKPPPPPPPQPQLDENGEEIPPPPKPKKQQREEAERKKQDDQRLLQVLQAEHAATCLGIKLANLLRLHAVRVEYVGE